MSVGPDPLDLLGGRFRLEGLLGSGGSASVYAATDLPSGAEVAVKVLHPALSEIAQERQRFAREALMTVAASGSLTASVIATALEEADAVLWIAMDRVRGVSLAELVETNGPVDEAAALEIVSGVLAALVVAHAAGIVHRDVAPENVVVEATNAQNGTSATSLRLIDWGTSAETGTVSSGEARGTVHYVSPEQAEGQAADVRSDLYQVGGLLHFALTGRPPFERSTVEAVLAAHRSSPPPVVSVARSGISRGVDRIVVRAMVKHPDGRFASALEMLMAVEQARASVMAKPRGERPAPRAQDGTRTTVLPAAAREVFAATALPGAEGKTRAQRRGRRASLGGTVGAVSSVVALGVVVCAWLLAAASAPLSIPAVTPTASPSAEQIAPTPKPSQSAVPGVTLVRMPIVEGLALADARGAIESAGLTVGELTIQNAIVAGDTILSASAAPGAGLAVGSSVSLVVASGSNSVPSVAGVEREAAIAVLQAAGFVAVVTVVEAPDAAAGQATGTSPGAGAVLRVGSEVLVSIATAASNPSPRPSPGASPAPSSSPGSAIR